MISDSFPTRIAFELHGLLWCLCTLEFMNCFVIAADDSIDLQNKSCEFRNSEPNLVAFQDDRMITANHSEMNAGTELVFRCSDIGKFSMIGSVRRRCINGEWDGIKPACFGLSQENDYAR